VDGTHTKTNLVGTHIKEETNIHVAQCIEAESNTFFNITMEVVDDWLNQSPTQMAIAILELLHAFRERRDLNGQISTMQKF